MRYTFYVIVSALKIFIHIFGEFMRYSRLFSYILASTFCVPTTMIHYAYADANETQLLQQMNQRMISMEHEVNSLQGEVKVLKTKLHKKQGLATRSKRKYVAESNVSHVEHHYVNYPENYDPSKPVVGRNIKEGFPRPPLSLRKNQNNYNLWYSNLALLTGGSPVFSSPYIGINSAFDGSDLIVNESSVNLDYRLLKQRQAMLNALEKSGVPYPDHPTIVLSGKIEGLASYVNHHPGSDQTDIDLESAALDAFIGINPWAFGFIDFEYDNSPNANNAVRVSNSRVFLRQGFLTIGRPDVEPFYATMGQLFVPFGQHSSFFITNPLTLDLGRAKQRAIVLGYHPDEGLYANVYGFKGNTDVSKELEGGGTLGIHETFGKLTADASLGLISNLAESDGMQETGLNETGKFNGFGDSVTTENLVHAVPGFDARASLNYLSYTLSAEYVRATRAFDASDLEFGTVGDLHGAEPQAFHIEGIHSFYIYGLPSNIALGWDFSREALALLLPKDRFETAFSIAPWKDTIATLEYDHSINYGEDKRGFGICDASDVTCSAFAPLDKTDDAVLFQFGVYF